MLTMRPGFGRGVVVWAILAQLTADRDQACGRYAFRECLWLRDTLEFVARELERMAARGQGDTKVLLGRARRVRQRLHQGVPDGWTAGR